MTPAPEQPVREPYADLVRKAKDWVKYPVGSKEFDAVDTPEQMRAFMSGIIRMGTALAERDATIRERDAEIEQTKHDYAILRELYKEACNVIGIWEKRAKTAEAELARRSQPDEAMVEAAGLAGMSAFSGLTGQDAVEAFEDCKPIWTRTARGCLSVLAARPAEPGATRGET